MKKLLLVIGLLCLARCVQERTPEHWVEVQREIYRPNYGTHCVISSTGATLGCYRGTGSSISFERLTLDEFQFRYKNEPAFRDSIRHYDFK